MGLLSSLRHKHFAFIWFGQTLSRLGDSFYRVALAWWVLEKTGSATAMGKVLIFSFTPMLLFMLLGGVAGDRLSKVRLMLVSDVARGAVVLAVAALAYAGRLEIWHVYAASIVFGFVSAFFQPAYSAIMPQVVPKESLPSANSLTGLSKQLSDVVGPTLSALAVQGGGAAAAFAVNGASFLVSAVCLLPVLNSSLLSGGTATRKKGLVGDVSEGIQAVLASPWLWATITLSSVVNITLSAPVRVAYPFLVKEEWGADVGALGVAYSMMALGSVLATAWLGRKPQIRRRGWLAYGSVLALSVGNVLIGVSGSVVASSAVFLLTGAAVSVFTLAWVNTLQEFVPGELLGRVFSIDNLGSALFMPLGFALVGIATDRIGASAVFVGGGVLTFLLTAAALLHPRVRNVD